MGGVVSFVRKIEFLRLWLVFSAAVDVLQMYWVMTQPDGKFLYNIVYPLVPFNRGDATYDALARLWFHACAILTILRLYGAWRIQHKDAYVCAAITYAWVGTSFGVEALVGLYFTPGIDGNAHAFAAYEKMARSPFLQLAYLGWFVWSYKSYTEPHAKATAAATAATAPVAVAAVADKRD